MLRPRPGNSLLEAVAIQAHTNRLLDTLVSYCVGRNISSRASEQTDLCIRGRGPVRIRITNQTGIVAYVGNATAQKPGKRRIGIFASIIHKCYIRGVSARNKGPVRAQGVQLLCR
jgi:hypothetical protein